MSATVAIYLKNLSYSLNSASSADGKLEDYSDDIQNKVFNKLSNLPGSDPQGYIAGAITSSSSKIGELTGYRTRITELKTKVDTLITDAKAADDKVAKNVKTTASKYVGKRTWYEKVGDWLYNTFCVDFMNSNPVTKFIGDVASWVGSRMSGVCADVYNWFKYKDGKYVWNLIKTGVGVVAAAIGAVAAVAAVSFATPIVAIVTIAAAAAAVVLLGIAMFNSFYSVKENASALDYYKDGEIGRARYHGNVNSFSEYNKKTDRGGEETNNKWKKAGDIVDGVETAAEVVSIVTGVISLGAHKSAVDGKVDRYSFKDFKHNVKESFGFSRERYILDENGKKTFWSDMKGSDGKALPKSQKPKSGYKVGYKHSFSKMFNGTSKYFGGGKTDIIFFGTKPSKASHAYKMAKLTKGQRVLKRSLETINIANKTMDRVEKVDKLLNVRKTGIDKNNAWSLFKAGSSTFDFIKPIGDFKTLVEKPVDQIFDIFGTDPVAVAAGFR